MSANDKPIGSSKAMLVDGAVKPWHVLFLYCVCFAVGQVAGFYLTRAEDPAIRRELWTVLIHAIGGSLMLAITIIVPEFRRSLPTLFSSGVARVSIRDFALALGVALCWGYGVYRIAFCFPVLLAYPDTFQAHLFGDVASRWEPKYLLVLFGTVFAAPLGEELVFRGYLMNLWIARWGVWSGILLSSLVFGVFHWERAVFAAPLGFIFALVYLRYDTLWPGIFLHALYNLLAAPWLLGNLFYVKQRSTIDQLSSWIPELLMGLLFIPLAVIFWKRFKPPRPV